MTTITTPFVQVAGVGLWTSGYPSLEAWRESAPDADALRPEAASLKPMYRRRASLLGRAIADASAEAMAGAQVDPSRVQLVVGSAVAEAATLLGMLDQVWRHKEPVSPAAFTMSVHNAASGLMSISQGNRGFVTSLAAGADTPAAALLEGVGLVLTSDQPVVVVCGDETSPENLMPETRSWRLLAASVVLLPAGHPGPCLARLHLDRPLRPDLLAPDFEAELGRNPQVGLADLVDAVARRATGIVALDRGGGAGWCATIAPGREA